MIEVKPASELEQKAGKRISEIFVDGFGKGLTYFSTESGPIVIDWMTTSVGIP